MAQPVPERVTAEELLRLPLFEGENVEAVEWIASNMQIYRFEPAEVVVQTGDEVTTFSVILDGEIHFHVYGNAYGSALVRLAGGVMGILPFSRMKTSPGRGVAMQATRVAVMDASHLRELVYRAPLLAQRLVSEMTDRTREATRRQEGTNKLLALGKLSAGLAHELNNPASAAVRSSARLRKALAERRECALALRGESVPERARQIMSELSHDLSECSTPGSVDALERADREADMADWLEGVGVPGELASAVVDTGITEQQLAPLADLVSAPVLTLGLRILAADHEMDCLTRELEEASHRISELVQAVKSYSYMDQVAATEVDVAQGIDNTLRMFQHQLKQGVQVVKTFAPELPRIRCNGSALNQIWTNLIDNALHAMGSNPPDRPKVLEVKTCTEPEGILVEIADSGAGIPAEIQGQIFDPFFTTKAVGEGTGLGLDIVQRIVRGHNGSIRVQSQPGRTVFQVRLPR